MKALPTTGRPCRGRTIAWSRTVTGVDGGAPPLITLRAFKRDSTGRSFMADVSLTPWKIYGSGKPPRTVIAEHLLACRAQVRWAVDQVEFQRLGLHDPTPCPELPA